MRYLCCIVLFISFSQTALCQQNYDQADSLAAAVTAADLTKLHFLLTEQLADDNSMVRAFYSWITHNIRYDVSESLKSKKDNIKQEPEVVFNSKRAICHGFSSLFMELCFRSGIPCYMVSGYTRIEGRFDNAGHTWNVVFLDDKWQPVDATWGAGGVNSQGRYIKQFTDKYFLTAPLEFLSEHYSFDPMWQLLFYPAAAADFRAKDFNYEKAEKSYFNFNDTIAKWVSYDSLERTYTSALRMVRYNPGDPVIGQQLSYANFLKGNLEFESGNRIMAALYPRKQTSPVQNSTYETKPYRLARLDSIETYYNNASAYYRLVKMSDPNDQAVLRGNLEALKFNMEVVRKEKLRLKSDN